MTREKPQKTVTNTRRTVFGILCGAIATLAMTAIMAPGIISGVSPVPKPIPVVLTAKTIGNIIPKTAVKPVGIFLHFCYGALFGVVLANLRRNPGVKDGLVLGVLLWLLMNLVALPYIGWGLFGSSVNPMISIATLLVHLVYGLVLGLLLTRYISGDEFGKPEPET
ncbi:MAG: DUF6789 family protein [Halobacteria archaeon]